ncbi:MAG: TusE/DsrC/DsvC family sulfur relay protein [Pseudomonadota bacterium]
MAADDPAVEPQLDHEGFLKEYRQWNEAAAERIAADSRIALTAVHWQVLHAARAYYERYERSPEMRPFINWLRREGPQDQGSSIALMTLFPDETVRLISKIAGLPKPSSCL